MKHNLFLDTLQAEIEIDNRKNGRQTCQWHNLDTQTNFSLVSAWHVVLILTSEPLSETLSDMKQCLVFLSGPVLTRAIKEKKSLTFSLSYHSV